MNRDDTNGVGGTACSYCGGVHGDLEACRTRSVAGDDEAYRQHQRDRIAEAQRHDAEQAKPKLAAGVDLPAPHSADAVLSEVVKWALAGHIGEMGVTVEAGNAIRAVVSGVSAFPKDATPRAWWSGRTNWDLFAAGVMGAVNPACGVHGPIPCEGAGCTCGVAPSDGGQG